LRFAGPNNRDEEDEEEDENQEEEARMKLLAVNLPARMKLLAVILQTVDQVPFTFPFPFRSALIVFLTFSSNIGT
jgi:hypothetical protein